MPPAEAGDDPRRSGPVPVHSPLPLQLHLEGRRCVVVGAGPVGARRALRLVGAGAQVVVVAPEIDPTLERAGQHGDVVLVRRAVRDEDLAGATLVVVATGDRATDEHVGAVARATGALVNRADDAGAGDVSFPAVVQRGPVSFAVSTGSRAPAAARAVAELLDTALDEAVGLDADGYVALVELVQEVRTELAASRDDGTGVTPGPMDWRRALDATILGLIGQGRRAEAKERLLACLSSS